MSDGEQGGLATPWGAVCLMGSCWEGVTGGSPVPVGSVGFGAWEEHTCWLVSTRGGDRAGGEAPCSLRTAGSKASCPELGLPWGLWTHARGQGPALCLEPTEQPAPQGKQEEDTVVEKLNLFLDLLQAYKVRLGCACVPVSVWTGVHVCMCTCAHMSVRVCMSLFAHACTYACVPARVCVCVSEGIYVCVYLSVCMYMPLRFNG